VSLKRARGLPATGLTRTAPNSGTAGPVPVGFPAVVGCCLFCTLLSVLLLWLVCSKVATLHRGSTPPFYHTGRWKVNGLPVVRVWIAASC
jgi:hypothetical protein